MKFSDRKKHKPPAIVIISLIDILIVLLIFLMVTTTFHRTPALRLTLPTSNTAHPEGETEQRLVVTVAKEAPHLYLGLRPITAENLASELASLATENENLKLTIRSDKSVPFGMFVKVLDSARAANISNLKVQAKHESQQ